MEAQHTQVNIDSAISVISSLGKTFILRNSADMCTMSLVFAGVYNDRVNA